MLPIVNADLAQPSRTPSPSEHEARLFRPQSAPGQTPWRGRRILIVEDDEGSRTLLRRVLQRHGLEVLEATDATGALRLLFGERPDLVVVDLGLPDLAGDKLIGRIRELTDVPVMVVTAERAETAAVQSLRAGADDYITKPFGVQELLARVEVLLRRSIPPQAPPQRYSDGLLEIDFSSLEVRAGGRVIELTALQLRLLTALVRHRGQVLSAEQLLKLAWDDDLGRRDRVKLYVGYLRRSFRDHGVDLPIETVRGFGYRYRAPRD
jgi:DNA-binding response OmpR family regulator